jgi:hypothetical protein
MQKELLIRAITQGTIGVIFLALLLALLFTLRTELQKRKRLSNIVIFALAMLGLWSFLAFAEVFVSVREMITSPAASDTMNTSGMPEKNPKTLH